MSNNSYSPNEAHSDIIDERTWLQGVVLTGVGYGVVVTLFSMCFRLLFISIQSSRPRRKHDILLLIYISVMFILGSLFMGSDAKFTQLAFIDDRNFPGGPNAYENTMFSIPVDTMGNTAFILANWCSDALMIWRYLVIYRDSRLPLWVIALIPCLTYCASFSLSVLWLKQLVTPSTSPFQIAGTAVNFTLPYLSLTLALNISVTILIVLRLLHHRHKITKILGPDHGSHYIGIATMLVESAALFSGFALLFLIPFIIGNTIANTFLQALGEVQIIAQLLIIFRVAQGKGWSADISNTIKEKGSRSDLIGMSKIQAIRFAHPASTGSGSSQVPSTLDVCVTERGAKETKVFIHREIERNFDCQV